MTYLKCVLDESISGEAMRLQLIYKINEKLKFLYRKNKVLRELSSMLCHALIQSHLDYGCPAWYLNLNKKKTKKKIQSMQNKCMQFCLRVDKIHHVPLTEFRPIIWLPTKEGVAITFKFTNNNCLFIWMESLNLLRIVE